LGEVKAVHIPRAKRKRGLTGDFEGEAGGSMTDVELPVARSIIAGEFGQGGVGGWIGHGQEGGIYKAVPAKFQGHVVDPFIGQGVAAVRVGHDDCSLPPPLTG